MYFLIKVESAEKPSKSGEVHPCAQMTAESVADRMMAKVKYTRTPVLTRHVQ